MNNLLIYKNLTDFIRIRHKALIICGLQAFLGIYTGIYKANNQINKKKLQYITP